MMNHERIDLRLQRDLNPPVGRIPLLESWGRKRRLEAGRIIAEQTGIAINDLPEEATVQLYTLYYRALRAGSYVGMDGKTIQIDAAELDKLARERILG